jgi:hypothetical protein
MGLRFKPLKLQMLKAISEECTKCGYKVTGIVLFQASHLYTHSLLRGVTFGVTPLSSYALSPAMLSLMTFLEFLL